MRGGGESDADDDIPDCFQLSPYYDNDSIFDLLKKWKSTFILFSFNCQSLSTKFEQLSAHIDNPKEQH